MSVAVDLAWVRETLETALVSWLPRQRWFGGGMTTGEIVSFIAAESGRGDFSICGPDGLSPGLRVRGAL